MKATRKTPTPPAKCPTKEQVRDVDPTYTEIATLLRDTYGTDYTCEGVRKIYYRAIEKVRIEFFKSQFWQARVREMERQ